MQTLHSLDAQEKTRQAIRRIWRPRVHNQRDQRYPLSRSGLFGMSSIHRLAKDLGLPVDTLRTECRKPSYTQPRVVQKGSARAKPRNIGAPLGTTLALHYRLLQLFDRVERPAFLQSATRDRSYVTNAALHARGVPVAVADIRRFFEATTRAQIAAFFRVDLQMRGDLPGLLADLCTTEGHLPLGSPLSPLLSYLVHRRLFDRIDELCSSRGLVWSLYIDDMSFSGLNASRELLDQVRWIVRKADLQLKDSQSRVFMAKAPKEITGCAIRGQRLQLPGARFLGLSKAIRDLHEAPTEETSRMTSRIQGQLSAARMIDPAAAQLLGRRLSKALAKPVAPANTR